jgi:hypothetical protein
MPRRPIFARPPAAAYLVALPLALGSLSACGGSGQSAGSNSSTANGAGSASAATATSSSAVVADSSALVADLGRTGRGCTASTGPANTIHLPGLRSSLNCVISGAAPAGSADATVAVFDNHTDAAAFATMLTSSDVSGMLLGGTHERAVLGSNWVVLMPDDASYADAVHTALGGTELTGGSSTAGSGPSSTG